MKTVINDQRIFTIYLISISFFGMMNTDIFLPCVHLMSVDLDVSAGKMQYIFLTYFLGVGISQFFCGSFSDSQGRRIAVLSALLLTSIGSVLCALSVSLTTLVIGRFILGVGAGVLIVIWRAIAYDVLDKKDAFHMIANVSPAIVLSPAISPILGGTILHISNWHFVFAFASAFSILLFIITLLLLPETIKIKGHDFSIHVIIYSSKKLLLSSRFSIISLGLCIVYAGYFLYIIQSPFIFHKLGYSPLEVSFFYIPVAISYFLGTRLTKFSLSKIGKKMLMLEGLLLFIIGALGIISFCHFIIFDFVSFLIFSFCILAIGNGIILTIGSTEIMSLFSTELNASASSLLGFMQSLSTVLITYMISILNGDFSYRYGLSLLYFMCILLIFTWFLFMNVKKTFK